MISPVFAKIAGRWPIRLALAAAMAAAFLPFTARTQGVGRHFLRGHVPEVVAGLHLQPMGRLPATNVLNLAIGLPLRNRPGLDALLQQLSDPASPNFRKFLTPDEFTARFGPTEADYAAVLTFARTNGLVVTGTYGNRLLLDVAGPAAAVENAFHITLRTYRHPTEAREFFAPDAEPSVDLALPVADIQGLSDFSRPRPKIRRLDAAQAAAQPAPRIGSAPDSSGDFFGNDFRNAYAPNVALTGAGQMVGLFELDGFYPNDIAAYAAAAGGGRTNIIIQAVLTNGVSGTPGYSGIANANAEVSLDIEMAMAMAPGLTKIVVFEGSQPNSVLNCMLAFSNTVKNLSCSWGWGGGPTSTTDSIFQGMQAVGQTFFNAAGDGDAFPSGYVDNSANPTVPSSNPYITQVGGTALTMNGTGASYASETVWNQGGGTGSGGGISSHYTIPSWQTNVSNMAGRGGSTSFRNIPDVAMSAYEDMYIIYGGSGQGSDGWGGTSFAAPLWAGFMALVNQQAAANGQTGGIGFINPAIYTIADSANYTNCFHDITAGNNTWSGSPSLFYATNGYDLCTGLGSPVGQNLINALAGPPDTLGIMPMGGFNASGWVSGPFSPASQNYLLTNSSASSFTWSLVNTSAWLNASSTSGTLAAGATSSVTMGLAANATSLAIGAYAATVKLTNWNTHVVQSLQFNLQVLQPLVVAPATGFTASGPVGGPFNITNQNFTLTNAGTIPLNWSLINTSAWLTVTGGGALAAGAAGTATVGLSSTANSLAAGNYAANVWFTNQTSGGAIALQFNLLVGQSLVQNGGFETGDVTGWTETGDTTYISVVGGNSTYVHSGTYGAKLGPVGALSYLSQTLPTSPGQSYLLSFWLSNPNSVSTEQIQASWNGTIITNLTNPAAFGWTQFNFHVTATAASTVLQFGFRNDPAYFGFDDVSVAPIYPPSISTQPTNQTVVAGNNAAFTVMASGAAPLVYQWRENGTNISNGGNISGATTNVLGFTAVTTNNAGNYAVVITNAYGSVTSSVAVLAVGFAPSFSTQPTNLAVLSDGNAMFSATVGGSTPLAYQWRTNGVNLVNGAGISGATSNVLTLTTVTTNSAGNYTLIVTNSYGSATSSIAVLAVGFAPAFSAQPTNLTVLSGGNAAFSATVSGSTPLAYQWRTNGVNLANGAGISGATTNVLTLTAVTTNYAGNYTLVVTNSYGSATSSIAVLAVGFAPAFSAQPTNLTVLSGGNAVFSATVGGSTPLAFQWRTNGVSLVNGAGISGATTNVLSLTTVSTNSSGNYSLFVTNGFGAATSSVVTLTVNLISPVIALASSVNPAGFNDAVAFAATLTPTNAAGTIQFQTNGTAFDLEPVTGGSAVSTNLSTLPRGTNSITAIYSGDANDLPATNTLAQIVTNHPPAAVNASFSRQAGYPLDIAVSGLVKNWSDADGDTVSLAAIGVSTNGVTVANNAGTLVYFDTNNVDDRFVCTISDGWGGTNFQTISIAIVLTNTIPKITGVGHGSNGGMTLNLAGAPGDIYVLETTTNLALPSDWDPMVTNTMGTNGVWQFIDTQATNFPRRFYRLKLAQ